MGRVVKHRDDSWAVIYVRVPGWLKNEITKAAKKKRLSVNAWAANQLLAALKKPLPEPITPPLPQQIVEGRIVGSPVLEPCGDYAPCQRTGTFELSGFEYCEVCRIRLTQEF